MYILWSYHASAEFTSHALVYGIAPSWTNCITYMQLMPWDLKTIWAHNSRWIVVRQPLSQISIGFLMIPPIWTNFSMGEIQCQCDIAILEINIRHFSFFIMIIASPPPWWSCLKGLYSLHPTPVSLHYCICPTWTPELIHRRVSFPAIAVAGVDTCVVFGMGEILYLDGTLVEASQKLSGQKLWQTTVAIYKPT